MRYRSIFWPLALIAAGVIWMLINAGIIPAANLWALAHMLPYLLMALGVGLIVRSQWHVAGMIVSALIVIGAVAAIFYAPQLGWTQIPAWGFDPGIGGGVQGSGKIAAEARKATDFTAVSIEYPATVLIRQGGAESVKVEADDNLLPQLGTEVRGGTLHIQSNEKDWGRRVHPTQVVKVTITVKDLHKVDFSSAGELRVEALKTTDFEVNLSGAGKVTLTKLNVGRLDGSLTGAGDIYADGTADKVTVSIDGFGSFYGDELQSLQADVTINGAGSANVRVKESLTAEINGAGSVGYYGDPNVNKHINGVGAVNKLGD